MNDNGKITKEAAHIYGAAKNCGVDFTAEEIEEALETAPEIDWDCVIAIVCFLGMLSLIFGYIMFFMLCKIF